MFGVWGRIHQRSHEHSGGRIVQEQVGEEKTRLTCRSGMHRTSKYWQMHNISLFSKRWEFCFTEKTSAKR